MRKIAFWFIVIMAIAMVGSLSMTGAPAEARPMQPSSSFMTNSVNYAQLEAGLPADTKLYVTNPVGLKGAKALGSYSQNVEKICPRNDNFQLLWSVVGSVTVKMAKPGACVELQNRTGYRVIILSAR